MPRVRSHWAWGYEDAFPSDAVRRALALRFASLFGGGAAPRELLALPSLASVAPRLSAPSFSLPSGLQAIATADPHARALHTYGRGYRDIVRGFHGDFGSAPDWVFFPTEEFQLTELFDFCAKESIAVVPYGGGTGTVGGTEHRAGGRWRGTATVDMSRMNAVLEVDSVSRLARIQGGATGPHITAQLHRYGLTLKHYPRSYEFSTLGGWIATRARGHSATRAARIDDLVTAVGMVCPAGVASVSSACGNGAERFMLGTEGTIGIVTEAWVRVEPHPRWRASARVGFHSFEQAVSAVRWISQSGLFPSTCSLFDASEAALHELVSEQERTHVLVIAFESSDHPVDPWMERALSMAADLGGDSEEPRYSIDVVNSVPPRVSAPPSEPPTSKVPPSIEIDVRPEALTHARNQASFFEAAYLQSALVSLGIVYDTIETTCTWSRFNALHEAAIEALSSTARATCGHGMASCRVTHVNPEGPSVAYTFAAPARAHSELEVWEAIRNQGIEAILAHGGTLTQQAAVGRLNSRLLDHASASLPVDAMLSAPKGKLDPQGIMNPGCGRPHRGS